MVQSCFITTKMKQCKKRPGHYLVNVNFLSVTMFVMLLKPVFCYTFSKSNSKFIVEKKKMKCIYLGHLEHEQNDRKLKENHI